MKYPNLQEPPKVSPLSQAVVRLTTKFNNQSLSTGTGIIIKKNERFYLITALHNLTGKEVNGIPKHKDGGLPNKLFIEGPYNEFSQWLYNNDRENPEVAPKAFWAFKGDATFDLAVLPVDCPLHSTLSEEFIDPEKNTFDAIEVTQQCHVVGYPDNIRHRMPDSRTLPISVTGHIATEPHFPFNEALSVLIDAPTRPGFSGSPVFVKTSVGGHRLLGIYIGRAISNESPLGMVVRPDLIKDLIDHPVNFLNFAPKGYCMITRSVR